MGELRLRVRLQNVIFLPGLALGLGLGLIAELDSARHCSANVRYPQLRKAWEHVELGLGPNPQVMKTFAPDLETVIPI